MAQMQEKWRTVEVRYQSQLVANQQFIIYNSQFIIKMDYNLKADKAEFIQLLQSTGREGVDDLIEYLDDGRNHFFTAPASVNHHLNSDGGLLRHSLNVCHAALKLRELVIAERPDLEPELSKASVIIASLLHDICKADIYVPTRKKKKDANGLFVEVDTYNVDYRNFPMGHGEKSAIMALWGGHDIPKRGSRQMLEHSPRLASTMLAGATGRRHRRQPLRARRQRL